MKKILLVLMFFSCSANPDLERGKEPLLVQTQVPPRCSFCAVVGGTVLGTAFFVGAYYARYYTLINIQHTFGDNVTFDSFGPIGIN